MENVPLENVLLMMVCAVQLVTFKPYYENQLQIN